MALTQISTAGVKDDAVTSGKIPANAVGTSEIADDAVTTAKIAKPLDFADNEKARFGTGNDLELYHDGSNSYLINGTGDLTLQNGSGNTNQIRIRGQNGEESIVANGNGSVDLYYDNSKKLETITWGVDIQGNTRTSGDFVVIDNGKFRAGYASDLQIYHDGTDSIIKNSTGKFEIHADQFRIRNEADSKILFSADNNANVYLYYNNNEKLRTENTGITVTGTVAATSFTGDGSSLSGINTDLVSDTSPQLGGTLDLNGNKIDGADSNGSSTNIVLLGTGDDLKMYHDGNNSYLSHENGSGHLYLQGDAIRLRTRSATNNDDYIVCSQGGPVSLYHADTKKFETTSYGARVYGNLENHDGNITVKDAGKFTVGNSDDLQIYHDGNHSYVKDNGTGNLKIQSNATLVLGDPTGNIDYAKFINGGYSEIYGNNTKRFETTSYGSKVSGYQIQSNFPIASVSDNNTGNLNTNALQDAQLNSSNFYSYTIINQGSHFSASTGRFTCPVDGVYRLYFRISSSANANIRLRKNGNTINEAYDSVYSSNEVKSVSSEIIVGCTANDYLDVQVSTLKVVSGVQHKQVTFQLIA